MPPVSNVLVSLSELIEEYAAGSDLRMFFMLWFEKPISPRRYQPPKSAGGGGAYIGGGAIGRSAAKAIVENRVAAPAAMKDLTLRIGFVPLAGEAVLRTGPTSKLTEIPSHQI